MFRPTASRHVSTEQYLMTLLAGSKVIVSCGKKRGRTTSFSAWRWLQEWILGWFLPGERRENGHGLKAIMLYHSGTCVGITVPAYWSRDTHVYLVSGNYEALHMNPCSQASGYMHGSTNWAMTFPNSLT